MSIEYKLACGDVLIIDDDFYDIIKNYFIRKNINTLADGSITAYYYGAEKKGNKGLSLGSIVLGVDLKHKGRVVHINENNKDFRKCNLKIVSINSTRRVHHFLSKYKGVRFNNFGYYNSIISLNGKGYCLGSYESPEVAAIAYNKAMDIAVGKNNYIPNVVETNSCLEEIYEKVYIRNIFRDIVSNQGRYVKNETATSKFIGVSFDKTREKYASHISYKKHNIFIKRGLELECGIAYNKVAYFMYGQNAVINNIPDWNKAEDILSKEQWDRILLNLDRAGFNIKKNYKFEMILS